MTATARSTAAPRSRVGGSSTTPPRPLRSERTLHDGMLEAEARQVAAGRSLRPGRSSAAGAPARPAPGLGEPLPTGLRLALQARLGADLRQVRVHHDAAAAQAAADESARAFTSGAAMVFGTGQWQPGRPEGQALIAHEATHAAQQQQPGAQATTQRDPRPGSGLGRSAPTADFIRMDAGEAGGTAVEDTHLLFGRDEATLTPAGRTALDELVAGRTEATRVHVHGYASAEGDHDYNMNLSAHRAVAVKAYLESVLPADSRITAYAYGETRGFGAGAQNRRVGVDVLEGAEFDLSRRAGRGFSFGLGTLTLDAAGPGTPATPPVPDLRLDPDLLPSLRGLQPGPGVLPTFTLPPLSGGGFDVGAVAPDFAARGLPYTDRDARGFGAHYELWFGIYLRSGLSPDLAQWLAQKGTESAVRTQLSLEALTEQELMDRRMGTEPTIVPVFNDAVMRWLFEQFK